MRGGLTSLIACLALGLFLNGCGGGESTRSPATTSATTTKATTTVAAAPPRPRLAPLRWRQPTIKRHRGYRVNRIVVHDIVKGTGPKVGAHDYLLMDYVEGDWTRGLTIYDAWNNPGPVAGVILVQSGRWRGLTIGMRGMRVGGRRQIVVPPRLGGIEPAHADWKTYLVWEVALRGVYARGCDDLGKHCRSGPY